MERERDEEQVAPGVTIMKIDTSTDCANNLEDAAKDGYFKHFGANPERIGE